MIDFFPKGEEREKRNPSAQPGSFFEYSEVFMKLLLAAAAAVTDVILKDRIEEMPGEALPRDIAGGVMRLDRFHNYGFSLSRGEQHPELVTSAVTGIYTLFLGHTILRSLERNHLPSAGAALILGGGISNLLDRLTRGYVVDYIRFPRTRFSHLIMNIGDLCLLAGCLLMAAEDGSSEE